MMTDNDIELDSPLPPSRRIPNLDIEDSVDLVANTEILRAARGVDEGTCTFYDVTKANNLSVALRNAFAKVMLSEKEQKDGPNSKKLETTWNEMANVLETKAQATKRDRDKSGIAEIYHSLELWTKEKKGKLSRMYSALKSKESNEAGIVAYLERVDAFPISQNEHTLIYSVESSDALAIRLLGICGNFMEYCGVSWEDAAMRDKHVMECNLRPFACESPECDTILSVRYYKAHDKVCPYKRLTCDQGCGEIIQRQEMRKHMTTICSMKPISCPYKRLGCDAELVLGTLEDHLASRTDTHLWLAVLLLDKQDSYIQELQQKMDQLVTILDTTERELNSQHYNKVKAIEKYMASIKSQISSHNSETRKQVSAVKAEQDHIRTQYKIQARK
eukprot:CFRG0348T1